MSERAARILGEAIVIAAALLAFGMCAGGVAIQPERIHVTIEQDGRTPGGTE